MSKKNTFTFSYDYESYIKTQTQLTFNTLDIFESDLNFFYKTKYDITYIYDLDELEVELCNEDNVATHFLFLRQSTITSFFSSNMIDMPICFKKSKSLYSKTFELPLLKFVNLIMRDGLREKTLKDTSDSFNRCYTLLNNNNNTSFNKWGFIYNFLTQTKSNSNYINYSIKENLNLHRKHVLSKEGYLFNDNTLFKNILFDKINEFSPVFSFYIRRVDKSIRKHSRGKSGKYTIIWKYVPVYKRFYVTMRWFLKELKFQKLKTFTERLVHTLETFLLTPNLSFVYKLRRFTHFFVFQNFKKTLLKTLKSTS